MLNRKSRQWCLREIILLLITYTKLGTLFHHFLLLLQVSDCLWGRRGEWISFTFKKWKKYSPENLKSSLQKAIFTCALLCTFKKFILCFVTGALISHEKLLLQINTEREIGDMDYKLGQVCWKLNFKLDFYYISSSSEKSVKKHCMTSNRI